MRPQDELRVGPIVLAGVIGAILTFAAIVGLSALFLHIQNRENEQKQAAGYAPSFRLLRSEQMEKLSEYRYQDEEKGTVRIPIELAMELVVREANESGK